MPVLTPYSGPSGGDPATFLPIANAWTAQRNREYEDYVNSIPAQLQAAGLNPEGVNFYGTGGSSAYIPNSMGQVRVNGMNIEIPKSGDALTDPVGFVRSRLTDTPEAQDPQDVYDAQGNLMGANPAKTIRPAVARALAAKGMTNLPMAASRAAAPAFQSQGQPFQGQTYAGNQWTPPRSGAAQAYMGQPRQPIYATQSQRGAYGAGARAQNPYVPTQQSSGYSQSGGFSGQQSQWQTSPESGSRSYSGGGWQPQPFTQRRKSSPYNPSAF